MMKPKSEIELWHLLGDFAKDLQRIASFREREEVNQCKYYEFDEAFEEYCHNEERCKKEGKRDNDFKSEEECWKCPFREVKA